MRLWPVSAALTASAGDGANSPQASLVIAMIMPITTNKTIAPCNQIQVGDMRDSLARPWHTYVQLPLLIPGTTIV
jgi:hypothetical protein